MSTVKPKRRLIS
ncbi:hypothetical protein LINPERHAP1_LOCUS35868 [Linum perenne]